MSIADSATPNDPDETNIDEPKSGKKTAVVVVHGMGEQRPMDTLWSFVRTMWMSDRDIVGKHMTGVYSKPDEMSASFELRRVTTRNGAIKIDGKEARKRVDFFELYWAHLMTGNSLSGVVWWFVGLVVRRPSSVPKRLLGKWSAALALFIISAAFFILTVLPLRILSTGDDTLLKLGIAVAGLLGGFVSIAFLRPVLGDAARYLSATPDNVGARQKIRQTAIDLLNALHICGKYDRIVVVGHSLGSVVAYDALNYAWSQIPADDLFEAHRKGAPALAPLNALEKATAALLNAGASGFGQAQSTFREAQRVYFKSLRDNASIALSAGRTRPLWLVSDFISAGSPLSNADVLLARDAAGFLEKKKLREFPTAPPTLEKQKPPRFSYPIRDPERAPHHAAVFAPTVWTNVYFANRFVLFGDAIAGPLRQQFGTGVRDVRIEAGWRFQHLNYWRDFGGAAVQPWLQAMRRAVNIRDLNEAELWGPQDFSDEVIAEKL